MENPKPKRILLSLFVMTLIFAGNVSGQQYLTKINGWNAYVHLPPDYNTSSKKYPVIVFMPGIGEVGSNASEVLINGPGHFINQGHNMEFMVNGIKQTPIVISLQPPAAWPAPLYLNRQIDSIYKRFRIDTNRLALTGLSMGGSGWDNYVPASPSYWKRPASIVAMSAPPPATPVVNFANFAATGGRWWGFEGTNDYRQMDVIRDIMNGAIPGSAKYTKYIGGHCCWNTWYNPSWTENGENIYQWMLKQVRNPLSTANIDPVVNAGTDQVLYDPATTITLNGVANDADGYIIGSHWTQISGPSGLTIDDPSALQTSVSNLSPGVYQFELRSADNLWTIVTDTLTITINAVAPPPNQAPIANAGNNITITLPLDSVLLQGSANDNDGSIVSYEWLQLSGPSQVNIINATAAQTRVSGLNEGTYLFKFIVTDDDGAMDDDSIAVTVNAAPPPPPNQPPVANAGSDINVNLPVGSFLLNGSATDIDGSVVSHSWSRISGSSSIVISDLAALQTLVTGLTEGSYQFRLVVTDDDGASDDDTVNVTVNAALPPPPNQSPLANAGNDISITLPVDSVNLSGSGNDSDGNIVSYNWSRISGPASYQINNASAASTRVNALIEGSYAFRLVVTDDDGATGDDTVVVIVNAAAPPPPPNQIPLANAGNDISITLPVDSVNLSGSGTDSDGNIVSYNWSRISGPASYQINNASAASTRVNALIEGSYAFRLVVTDDDGATGDDTVVVIVNAAAPPPPPNQIPLANAGNDISITLPVDSVNLTGSGTDSDGNIVSYNWSRISGPASYQINNASAASTRVNALVEGSYAFRLVVTDDDGATGDDTVVVIVYAATPPPPPNQIPLANAGNDISITLPVDSVNLSGSGTDSDGNIVGYTWSRISGPASYQINNASAASTRVNALVEGSYAFRLVVTDDDGASDDDTVVVIVHAAITPPPPVNQAPVAHAGNNITITLPVNTATLSGSATDSDGSIVNYSWTKISGPAQFNITSASSASTSVNNLVQGSYQFRLVATDDDGATDSDTVAVTVLATPPPPNQAPVAHAGNDITITLPVNAVTLSGSATDIDGSIATYSWSKISGPSQFVIVNSSIPQPAVNSLEEGVYSFRLVVMDDDGAMDDDTVRVIVNAAPNQLPAANAGNDLTITLPVDSVIVQGSGTDADGSIVHYSWTRISGPLFCTIVNSNAASSKIKFLLAGTYQFRLTVTDDDGASSYDQVTVVVKQNLPPTANAGDDQQIEYPTDSIFLNGTATDPDGSISNTRWRLIDGPAQYQIIDQGSLQTWVHDLTVGTYVFELEVTDDHGSKDRDTMQLTVKAIPVSTARLYPNPASSVINVRIDANTHNNMTTLIIYDVSGRVVHKEQFFRNQYTIIRQINVEKFLPGTYVVEIEADINRKQSVIFVRQ